MTLEALTDERAVGIAEAAQRLGVTVGVAESLTGGLLTARLAEAPEASTWLRGGVVAYRAEVKYDVLGVDPGPVVTAWAARQMARVVALQGGMTHLVMSPTAPSSGQGLRFQLA